MRNYFRVRHFFVFFEDSSDAETEEAYSYALRIRLDPSDRVVLYRPILHPTALDFHTNIVGFPSVAWIETNGTNDEEIERLLHDRAAYLVQYGFHYQKRPHAVSTDAARSE